MKENRHFGLDILRCLAVLLVIGVHAFYNLFFDMMKFDGFSMFVGSAVRWLCYICVPLFLLLTGYLNEKKKPCKAYYKKIFPILGSYLVIAVISILVRKLYFHEPFRWIELGLKIFNFTAIEYGWYVEMYIGLFLIIPFLNILYQGIPTKRQKQLLLLILLFLSCFATTVNGITVGTIKLDIFPDWWMNLYPILFYFIGSYIKEYQPKFPKSVLACLLFFVLLFQTLLGYFYYHSIGGFNRSLFDGFNSLPIVFMSVLVFLIFYNIKSPKKWVSKIVASISIVSFDMYLFSYIIDVTLYSRYHYLASTPARLLLCCMLFVPIVFLTSYILSMIKYGIEQIYKKIKKKKNLSSTNE